MHPVTPGFTRHHRHFDLDYLLAQNDTQLAAMLSGGTPAELRTHLVCLKAAGKAVLVVGGCDNQRADGHCAGHPSLAPEPAGTWCAECQNHVAGPCTDACSHT